MLKFHDFLVTSPKASIIAALLTSMLSFLDQLNLYEHSVTKTFHLLDGHGSRMMLPFLRYINDLYYKWVVCIEVPYATHIWQDGDASELNGAFQTAFSKAKSSYFSFHRTSHSIPTDIVPIINQAWKDSFAR
jgi:hypothetical protein